MPITVLGGGAASGLVAALTAQIVAAAGTAPTGDYGPVGGMAARVTAGEPVDVVILTKAIIADLVASGHADPATVADVGPVATGVAVREGAPVPDVSTAEALAAALRAAPAVLVPDMTNSTAGRHVAGVLAALSLDAALRDRLYEYPGGIPAMAALAARDDDAIGVTQITEIAGSAGVRLCGPLPAPHGLTTIYTAAVSATASDPQAAAAMVRVLTAAENAGIRESRGFV